MGGHWFRSGGILQHNAFLRRLALEQLVPSEIQPVANGPPILLHLLANIPPDRNRIPSTFPLKPNPCL
jgi:hypothetical protein